MERPWRVLLVVLFALAPLPLAAAHAPEAWTCPTRMVELRAELARTEDAVTDALAAALHAAYESCHVPSVRLHLAPEAPDCTTPQSSVHEEGEVELVVSVLGERRVFRETASSHVDVLDVGHHNVAVSAGWKGEGLAVYADNGGTGDLRVRQLRLMDLSGSATVTCGEDGAVCSAAGEAIMRGSFELAATVRVGGPCA